jgi:hypothetical protein
MITSIFACKECRAVTLQRGQLSDVEGDGIARTPGLGVCGIVRFIVWRQTQDYCRGRIEFVGYVDLMNLNMEREKTG